MGIDQFNIILQHIDTAKSQGARLIFGGKRGDVADLAGGCFIEATIFDWVDETMALGKEEVFGPVLAIMRVDSYEEALRLANNVPYGLSSSIFTSNYQMACTLPNIRR